MVWTRRSRLLAGEPRPKHADVPTVTVPDRNQPRHCTPQGDGTRQETPCDGRHTEVLTKILTNRLAKALGSGQTRRSPAIHDGVSEGIRTPDIQDHNLAL